MKGTRHVVKWRAATIAVLFAAVLAYPGVQYVANNAGTQTTTTATTTTTETTSTTASTSRTQTISTTRTTTTTSISPQVSSSDIAKISGTALLALVNRTGVTLSLSTTDVPYMVVRDSRNGTGAPIGLIYLTRDVAPLASYGYVAPVGVLVYVSTAGTIRSLLLWSCVDSYNFMVTQDWLNGFVNRSVFDPLQIGGDVQGITRATITSTGIASGIRVAGRTVVHDFQEANPGQSQSQPPGAIFSILPGISPAAPLSLLALLCLFAGAVVAYQRHSDCIKYTVFAGSILFLGLYA